MESFGIVLIEAMATGLLVIATEYPGVRAVVAPGDNGVLVPRGDADAIAAALRAMAELDDGERRRMGAAGREKAEREWAWPALVARMDDAYRAAIERRRSQRRGTVTARSCSLRTSTRRARMRERTASGDGQVPAPARPSGHGAHDGGLRSRRR